MQTTSKVYCSDYFAAAKLSVEEGAYVFITGRRQKELDAAVKAIGHNITDVQGDVAKLVDLGLLSGGMFQN